MKKQTINSTIDFEKRLINFSNLSYAEVLRKLKTDFDTGLDDEDVAYCHDRY